jgi:pSer/pThr/pTyr-binding forkhead associated (FHA) protein
MFGALHGVGGALAGRILPIDTAGFFIGREQSLSQVVIDNPSVSKRHVWVGVKDGAVVVADQQSTNGTYLNSDPARVTETRLKPGDILIISDDVAKLEYRV